MNQADITREVEAFDKHLSDFAPSLDKLEKAQVLNYFRNTFEIVRTDTLEEAAQAGEKLMDMPAEHEGAWNTAIRQFATIVRALKQKDV